MATKKKSKRGAAKKTVYTEEQWTEADGMLGLGVPVKEIEEKTGIKASSINARKYAKKGTKRASKKSAFAGTKKAARKVSTMGNGTPTRAVEALSAVVGMGMSKDEMNTFQKLLAALQ